MNQLSLASRVALLKMLIDGTGVRTVSRLTKVSINTLAKLLADLGFACAEQHHRQVRNLRLCRLKCDEIWSFVSSKASRSRQKESKDIWTWVALAANSKLCVSYLVGGRDGWWAREFMNDCISRVVSPLQITTDGRSVYMDAVDGHVGGDTDYAQLQSIYGVVEQESRYSPTKYIASDTKAFSGSLGQEKSFRSLVERRNPALRTGVRRFTRITDTYSNKVERHAAIVAIHLTYYNFARIHESLGITPAMAAGLAEHVWGLEEIALLANRKVLKADN